MPMMPGTKNDLTFYVCSGLLEYCFSKSTCKLVVVGTQRSWERIGRVTFTWRADSTLIHHQVMCWKRLPQHIHVCLVTRHGCAHTSPWTGILRSPWWSHPSQVVNFTFCVETVQLKLPLPSLSAYITECEWLIVTNVEGSPDSTTYLMLTGPGNLWISPRRPGLVHTWSFMTMTLLCTNCFRYISWWQYIPIKLVNGNCHSRSRVQSSLSATQQVPQTLTVTGSQ